MNIKLGVTLPQFSDDPDRFRSAVALAEEEGLDSIWLFDHLWPLSGGKQRPILECWSALGYVASRTSRLGIGTLVTRSSLRHPAVLAKMVATVGCVAPGRLTVTIGSGDEMSRGENEAFGLPYWSDPARVEQLRSTVRLVRSFLDGAVVSQSDGFVDVDALVASPTPVQRPRIWVAGRAGDTIEVAATLADGWNGWGATPERFAQDAQELLSFAGGRAVEPTWAGLVKLDGGDGSDPRPRGRDEVLQGDPVTVAARLNEFVRAGATQVIVTFAGGWTESRLRLLAREVRPLLGT